MFVIIFLLLVHHVYGASYQVQMMDTDLNCIKSPSKSSSSLPLIHILSMNIWDNQLSIPGRLDLFISFNVTKKLTNDLQLSVKFERQMAAIWVNLPCLSGLGSCDRQSFCDLIKKACTSKSFIQAESKGASKPCSCDLDVGIYSLEHLTLDLKYNKRAKVVKPITAGKYRFKIKIYDPNPKTKSNTVGCVIGYLTLSKP